MTGISERAEVLKRDLVMADLILKASYGFGDAEAIEKAWSDEARRAAAEARRHGSIADQHRAEAAKGGPDAKQHEKAAAMHDKAASQFTRASAHYGSSKIGTLGVGSLFGPLGIAAALPYRAMRQRGQRNKAIRLGSSADKFSRGITS